MKAHTAMPALGEDAVEHERVRMHVHAAPKRWMIATAPLRPSATPCARARRRSCPSTARMNTPTAARHSAWSQAST